MTLLVAITRGDVADYISTLVSVYVVLIFVYIISTFIPPSFPYNRYLTGVLGFVGDVVNPYLGLFRRVLPTARLGPAALDLSPIVGTITLILVGNIVANIVRG